MKLNRREKIFAAFAGAVLIVAMGYFAPWRGGGDSPRTEAAATPAAVRIAGKKDLSLDLIPLHLNLLDAEKPQFKRFTRNPFYFGAEPPPPPDPEREKQLAMLKASAEDTHRRLVEEEQNKIAARIATAHSGQELKPAPTFPLMFVGYVGPVDDEIAIFRDGKDFIMAKRGETLKGQYRIVNIGYETVEIAFTGAEETHRYPLTASGPAATSKK